MSDGSHEGRLRVQDIWTAWWPLAASWLLMGAEQPAIAAVIARLPEPEVGLGAYGSVVFPLALLIEAPIIMLLAASTELSRDVDSYAALRRFTRRMGLVLTALHILLAATPLGPWVITALLSVPATVAEAARPGLWLVVPWTWAIASRRTGQGLLIRYGHSRVVGVGTAIRLFASVVVLSTGLWLQTIPGVMVGTAALSVGVLSEAAFVGVFAHRVARTELPAGSPDRPPLSGRAFGSFYVPLALTPIILLAIQPVGTAAISRMPSVVGSLAVWPVIVGLGFVVQSVGVAYNEVVVALLGREGARTLLRGFAWRIAGGLTAIWGVFSFTPISRIWFTYVTGINVSLVDMAMTGMMIATPLPATRVLQSWYQGVLVASRRTAPITEAVVAFSIACGAVLIGGVMWQGAVGVYVAMAAFTSGRVVQTLWLAWRSRGLARISNRARVT